MTRTRRLALKIAGWVVRFSSQGCRNWAEGLAHEIAAIENDWAALRWAVGSVRILLDRRDPPIPTLADVPAAAHEYLTKRRRELIRLFWLDTSLALDFALIRHASQPHVYPDVVAGLLLIEAVRNGIFLKTLPAKPSDARECAAIYRRQLLRDIHFMTGWINVLSTALLSFGMIKMWLGMQRDATLYAQLTIIAFFIPAVGFSVYTNVRKLRYRVRDLDLLLTESD